MHVLHFHACLWCLEQRKRNVLKCSKHIASTFNTTKASWWLVSVPSEAGTETSIKISQRGHPVTARKKCHHLCVNISHVGGQVYWHLDDHPGPFSPALIDCSSTYISQQQGLAHVSFVRKKEQGPRWHKNKRVNTKALRSKYSEPGSVCCWTRGEVGFFWCCFGGICK